ncbi:MAG: hypothetical protein WC310_00580 [Patescibacteria group bacterium]|jgi:uncharacterized protein YxeA
MKKEKIVFVSIVVLVTVIITGIVVYKVNNSDRFTTADKTGDKREMINPAVQKKIQGDYEVELRAIYKKYQDKWQERAFDDKILTEQKNDWIEFLGEAKNQILALTVPGQYRELHLNFVLDIDGLLNGFERGDATAIVDYNKKISQLADTYNWLK